MSEKSEKEKMITGDLYYAGDPVLCEDRNKAHYLCAKLNKMKLDNPNGCTPQEMVRSQSAPCMHCLSIVCLPSDLDSLSLFFFFHVPFCFSVFGQVPVLRDMGMKFDEEHPPYIEPSFFCDYGYNISYVALVIHDPIENRIKAMG